MSAKKLLTEALLSLDYFFFGSEPTSMDYEELAARIEELESGEREAAVMLGRELMKFKRKPPRGRSHWIHLLWRLMQAYSGSEHPTVEDMEEVLKQAGECERLRISLVLRSTESGVVRGIPELLGSAEFGAISLEVREKEGEGE